MVNLFLYFFLFISTRCSNSYHSTLKLVDDIYLYIFIQHDPETNSDCVPGGEQGNYIMFARETVNIIMNTRWPNDAIWLNHTVCPMSTDPFFVVNYYIKWVTTSWTCNTVYVLFFYEHIRIFGKHWLILRVFYGPSWLPCF